MLYKSGNIKDCKNYRIIALISHTSKILLIIILNRRNGKVKAELSDCKAGYRKNRWTVDMLFILKIIIKKLEILQMRLSLLSLTIAKRLTV